MNSKITPEIQSLVAERHARFLNDFQKESPEQISMVSKGHPLAQAYRKARDFFDSLSFASESMRRQFSYKGMYESSEYEAPELDLTWWPAAKFSSCLSIHPGHSQWEAYISSVAAAGWPPEVEAEMRPGQWTIRTQNDDFRNALLELAKGRHDMRFTSTYDIDNSPFSHKVQVTQSVRPGTGNNDDALQLHHAIVDLLSKYHEGWVLPEGRFTDVCPKAESFDRGIRM